MAPTIDSSTKSTTITTSTPTTQLNGSTTFKQLLDDIDELFSRPDCKIDVDELWRVLEQYKSCPSDWSKYAFYDMRKYKRNLVAEHEKYNVMIITWGPNVASCIHDHSGSHCFMKVLDGELIESRFAWPHENQLLGRESQEMCRIADYRMGLDDVLYINDKVGLHRVENPGMTKVAASLHVYIPPYRKCKAFDQSTGRAQECKLSFYSKCGRVVGEDENCA